MIRIVTDSTANLPGEITDDLNIAVVPLKVNMGDKSFREGLDLSATEFYSKLPTTTPPPTTSQPSPADFEAVYRKLLERGNEVISIHLSSDLSGTMNSARLAVDALGRDGERITIVDSRTVSAGLGLLVMAAAQMAEAGQSREEIAKRLRSLMEKTPLVLTLDTLEYLKRGGRIGGAAAFIGGLLKIKPTIEVRNGKLEAGERARSRRRALELLVEKMASVFGSSPVWLGIAEAKAEDVDELERMLKEKLNVQKMIRCEIGPVVGTHTGPNTIGVAGMVAP